MEQTIKQPVQLQIEARLQGMTTIREYDRVQKREYTRDTFTPRASEYIAGDLITALSRAITHKKGDAVNGVPCDRVQIHVKCADAQLEGLRRVLNAMTPAYDISVTPMSNGERSIHRMKGSGMARPVCTVTLPE